MNVPLQAVFNHTHTKINILQEQRAKTCIRLIKLKQESTKYDLTVAEW